MSGWTDATPHDPGFTLVQALVWSLAGFVTAGLLYRFARRRDP